MTIKLSNQIPEEKRRGAADIVSGSLLDEVKIEWVEPVGARLVCELVDGQLREADGVSDLTRELTMRLEEELREYLAKP